MSASERRRDYLQQQRERIFEAQAGRCATCGRIHRDSSTMQLAHKVADTKANRKRWGKANIDHDWNKAMVCSEMLGGVSCNDAQNMAGRPVSADRLMAAIQRERTGVEVET